MNILTNIDLVDFTKLNGLVPAVVQDNKSMKVLMVGFMNYEARSWGKLLFLAALKTDCGQREKNQEIF